MRCAIQKDWLVWNLSYVFITKTDLLPTCDWCVMRFIDPDNKSMLITRWLPGCRRQRRSWCRSISFRLNFRSHPETCMIRNHFSSLFSSLSIHKSWQSFKRRISYQCNKAILFRSILIQLFLSMSANALNIYKKLSLFRSCHVFP